VTEACPPDSELQRLLADQLSEAEEAGLEIHVAGCPTCQARLEQLTRGARPLPIPPAGSASRPGAPPPPAGVPGPVGLTLPPQFQLHQELSPAKPERVGGAPETPSSADTKRFPAEPSRRSSSAFTLENTTKFLRSQVWVWPIVAAVLLGGAGWWAHRSINNAMRRQRINELTTVLEADVAALRVWMANQRAKAELIAGDEPIHQLVEELLPLTDPDSRRELMEAKAQAALRSRLVGSLRQGGFAGYVVVSPTGVILASDVDLSVGREVLGYHREFVARVAGGQGAVSRPFRSHLLLADADGEPAANTPVMVAAAPVRDGAGKTVAVLGLRIRPEKEFTGILQVARPGESGETYAFDRQGLLLSQSRFDDDLKKIGLLADQPGSRSLLTLELRDPGVNMVEGERPAARRADQPLTHMAAEAVQGRSSHNADGYRDYRGVPVVGAWRWLDEYDFGVATEMDVAEAFRPLHILRRAFWALMGLLVLSAVVIFLGSFLIARQQRALRKAAFAARQLGQYTLVELVGAGGMGTVYKARHALLRRPTAIKLLNLDQLSERAVARFEREVQITAGLTHPNTVAVFDYGRTPEGVFYYVMEYLDGITLEDLVTSSGPVPEARVLAILRQVCGSLAEAHAAGLVHRDVKPANIFLTCRGGLHDFVKVLDFGLAKAITSQPSASLTSPNTVAGTPLYLSPEAVSQPDRVDARADVYAIGAVGYYLLTGSPVFGGDSALEICLKHVQATPESPSVRSSQPVSPELEALLMRCLAKSPSERPANAAQLMGELENCAAAFRWTPADAATWWSAHQTVRARRRDASPADREGQYQPTVQAPVVVISREV
jgi:tRNA A-37 threonylcarbamoyl transferase component Bud32